MLHLNAAQVREALSMSDAVDAMRVAFAGESEMPQRVRLGPSLVMPGLVGDVMAVKVVSVVPGNPTGLVVVFAGDGSPLGVVDGHELTSIRTGAVTGLATELLAPPSASTMAMLGAGQMAPDMIEAVRSVRPIQRVLVWSRSRERSAALAERIGGEAVESPEEAVSMADVISCATPSTAPLFEEGWVRQSTHINAVGAFTPSMVELPAALLERAYVVVDDFAAAALEAGDLIQAGRSANASLAEVVAGRHPQVGEDVTVFKSVGLAIQDVAAAHRALSNASRRGLGTRL